MVLNVSSKLLSAKFNNQNPEDNLQIRQNLTSSIYDRFIQTNMAGHCQKSEIGFTGSKTAFVEGVVKRLTRLSEKTFEHFRPNKVNDKTPEVVSGKVIRFIDESLESIRNSAKKLKGKEELPVAKKPVTADMSQENDRILAKEAERLKVQQQIRDTQKALENARLSSSEVKNSDNYNTDGTISKYGQDKIDKSKWDKHHHDPDMDGSTKHIAGFRGASDTTANVTEQATNKAAAPTTIEVKADVAMSAGKSVSSISQEGKDFMSFSGKAMEGKTDALSTVSKVAESKSIAGEALHGVSEVLSTVEAIPAIGLALEALPAAKFLQPLSDFKNGDFKKGLAGTGTRLAELGLTLAGVPIKLIYSLNGSFEGLICRLFGEEKTGPIKGFKKRIETWNNKRELIENSLLGRACLKPEELEIVNTGDSAFNDALNRAKQEIEQRRVMQELKQSVIKEIEVQKQEIKEKELNPKFVYQIQREREGKPASIPNCIMIVGQDKDVTKELIEWTGKNSNCKFVQLKHTDNILEHLENAEDHYQQTRERTLFHVNNFDQLINPELTPEHHIADLKDIMSSSSNDYHSTIIFSTKDPSKLNHESIQGHRLEEINANLQEIVLYAS